MDDMTPEALENRAKIADIRRRLLQGAITYDEAKTEAQPILARINATGARIAREHGFKHKPITFSTLMR